MQRPCEKDRERGQSEQGSSCLERVPETFVRRSFLAEPPSGGEIDPLAGRPNQKIAQMLSTSSGGAIHAVIPIQKRKLLFIAAFPSTNGSSLAAFTSSCSCGFSNLCDFASSNLNQGFPLRRDCSGGGHRQALGFIPASPLADREEELLHDNNSARGCSAHTDRG